MGTQDPTCPPKDVVVHPSSFKVFSSEKPWTTTNTQPHYLVGCHHPRMLQGPLTFVLSWPCQTDSVPLFRLPNGIKKDRHFSSLVTANTSCWMSSPSDGCPSSGFHPSSSRFGWHNYVNNSMTLRRLLCPWRPGGEGLPVAPHLFVRKSRRCGQYSHLPAGKTPFSS